MPQSLSRLYHHTVFSTKNRTAFLANKPLQHQVHKFIAGIIKDLTAIPVEIGGVEDHIHILHLQPRTLTTADFVKELKRRSTHWLQQQSPQLKTFHWQQGYASFSVSQSNVETVTNYIRKQEQHHQKTSFKDEYRHLLTKHAIEFDERYVWD